MGLEALFANPFLWLGVAVIAALLEAVTVSLVTVWFVVGALVSFFLAYFGGPAWLQLIVFLVVSIACLILLRPFIMKYRKRGEAHEATLVGKMAVVTQDVGDESAGGRVKTPDGVTWTAISVDGSVIPAGSQVRIVNQVSIKLFVERM